MRIFRKLFLHCFACVSVFLTGLSVYAQNKPNIVIIYADDLGIGSVGAYGAPESLVQTPAIDGLATEGRKFMNAYTPSSLCSPSRYAILTGRYYWRDVREWGIIRGGDPNVVSPNNNLAARLKNEGYITACIGKWHLGYNSSGRVGGPELVGFDHSYDYQTGITDDNETRTAEFTDKNTSDWIDSQSSDTPFFLYFVPIAVHTPIIPGVEYQGSSGAGAYGDFINELDGSVQNILDALDRNGFSENTLIIFTSDNGAAAGSARSNGSGDLKVNGDYRGTKLTIFDAGFRVPFIVKWPSQVPAGTTSDKIINIVDVYASLMEMLNIEMGTPAEEAGDSHTFYKAWFDDANQPDRKNMILTSYEGINAIVDDRWKYIDGIVREPAPYDFLNDNRQQQEAHEQLYNLTKDPNETTDLANTNPDKMIELTAILEEVRDRNYSRLVDCDASNNSAPTIIGTTFRIDENISELGALGLVNGRDPDGNPLSFSIISGNDLGSFQVNGTTRQLEIVDTQHLNFETNPSFSLEVQVSDCELNDRATITVNLNDKNEAPTNIMLSSSSITENSDIGTVIGTLSSSDEDANESFTYYVSKGSSRFEVVGNVLSSKVTFDYELFSAYSVEITTRDKSGLTFSKTFEIDIIDEDDNVLGFDREDSEMVIYPNPTKDFLFIKWDKFMSATVYGLSGNKIFESKSNELDLSNLNQGIYLIRLVGGNNERLVFKFKKD
ncbi:MAG: sulfatase-like hydrolase/transferase [Cyclobacteriaceae bacterium]